MNNDIYTENARLHGNLAQDDKSGQGDQKIYSALATDNNFINSPAMQLYQKQMLSNSSPN